MSDGQLYYKRVGYVAIEGADGVMRSYGGGDGLDFKFSGEKVGDIYAQFEVGILGLSAETINDLTIWNPGEAIAASRKIAVYAGYEEGGIEHPLFEGIILEAIPTNPPEMWVNFKCLRFGDESGDVINPELLKDEKVGKIFNRLAYEFGLNPKWNAISIPYDAKVDFDYSGGKCEVCRKFAEAFGVTVFEEFGILYAIDNRPQLYPPSGTIIEVSQRTGMLALGNITLAGATIKTRLNDKSGLATWVRLTSEIVPKANGLYIVVRKKHAGHFRGQEWTTELETIRQGAKV